MIILQHDVTVLQVLLRSMWGSALLHSRVLECPLGVSQLISSKLLPPLYMISCHFIVLSDCPPLRIFNLLLYFSHNILGKILRLISFMFVFLMQALSFRVWGYWLPESVQSFQLKDITKLISH